MKMLQEESASAPASITNELGTLQNKLLIELLKKNIDVTTRTSSQDQPVYLAPSSLGGNEECVDSSRTMGEICGEIDRMITRLCSVSDTLKTNINAKQAIGLKASQVYAFLEQLDKVKKTLGTVEVRDMSHLFDRAKENVSSLIRFLVSDKKRVESMNEEYVERICEMRVLKDELKNQLMVLLSDVVSAKQTLNAAMENNKALQADNILTLNQSLYEFIQNLDFPMEEVLAVDNLLCRMNSTLWKVVCAVKQQKFRNRELKMENMSLSQMLLESRNLLEYQKDALAEQSKKYEEEIKRLQRELESVKSTEQTTPPTSATRKRRVLVDTVIAFTGLSRDPERLRELSDIAANKLQCKVHLSADFTSDITHVVCPSGYQSVRTMAAALSSKWIMSLDWLLESAKVGKLLPENSFGHLYVQGPTTLRSKTFYLTSDFVAQQAPHQMNAACCRTLIEPIGKGRVVEDLENCDFVLCGDREERKSRRWIRLKEFIRMIPGHNNT